MPEPAAQVREELVPAVLEPAQAVAFQCRLTGGHAPPSGFIRIGDQPLRAAEQLIDIGGHDAGLRRHRPRRFGGGQGNHRHSQVHGFQQGQSQGSPAHRVYIDAAAGQFPVQLTGPEVAPHREPRRVDPRGGGQAIGLHAEDVQRGNRSKCGQQVRSGDPAAADGFIHHHAQLRQLPRVKLPRVRDPVFDHQAAGGSVVPGQPVEVRDVHQGDGPLVRERVPGKREITLGSVVLHVHRRQVRTGRPAQQAGNFVDFLRALQHDCVNSVRVQRRKIHLPR